MFAQESSKPPQANVFVEDSSEAPPWGCRDQPAGERVEAKGIIARARHHDWTVGLLCARCVLVCWVCVYGCVGDMGGDAFFVGVSESVCVGCTWLMTCQQSPYI